jgi:hypothetical protein
MTTLILTLLPADVSRRLQAAVSSSFKLRPVSLSEIEHMLADAVSASIVIDPCLLRPESFASVVGMAARAGSSMLLYSSPNRLAAERALQAAHELAVEVCFYGSDDDPRLMRRLLENLGRPSVPALMLHALGDTLSTLEPALQLAAVGLFGGQSIPDTAEQFAKRARADEATVRRWLQHVGLRGVKRLLCCARVARAWEPLSSGRVTLERIVERYGFGSIRSLDDNFGQLIGLPPRRAARALRATEFAERLVVAAKT